MTTPGGSGAGFGVALRSAGGGRGAAAGGTVKAIDKEQRPGMSDAFNSAGTVRAKPPGGPPPGPPPLPSSSPPPPPMAPAASQSKLNTKDSSDSKPPLPPGPPPGRGAGGATSPTPASVISPSHHGHTLSMMPIPVSPPPAPPGNSSDKAALTSPSAASASNDPHRESESDAPAKAPELIPFPPNSPAYWFEMFKRKRDVSLFNESWKTQLGFFGEEFLTRDQLHFQNYNVFLKEHAGLPQPASDKKGDSKDGGGSAKESKHVHSPSGSGLTSSNENFESLTEVLAKLNQFRMRLLARFQTWQENGKKVVAMTEAFNAKLTAYNNDKKECHKAVKAYLTTKKTAGKKTLDAALEKALKLKQNLELVRLDMEQTARSLEIQQELTVMQSLNSCMLTYWEFFKQGYELLEPLQKKIEALNALVQGRARVVNDQLNNLRMSYKQWESQAVAAYERDLASGLASTTEGGQKGGIRDFEIQALKQKQTETTKEGELYIAQPFARVWCNLREDGMFMVESTSPPKDGKEKPDCALPIYLCTAKELPRDSPLLHAFTLISPQKTLVLQAESAAAMAEWLGVIQAAIAVCLANGGGPPPPKAKTADSAKAGGGGGGAAVETKSSSGAGPQPPSRGPLPKLSISGKALPKQREASVLQVLQTIDGNNQCADCDSMSPQWISTNLGIMFCTDCSGVHRGMGVSISKVRSATLDKIDNYLLAFLKAVGNTNANNIYVAKFKNKEKSRPHVQSNREMRELWIRNKYEHKKFLRPESDPELSKEEATLAMFKAIADDKPLDLLKAIAWGGDPNWQNPDEDGRTAFHQAVSYGNAVCVEMLAQNNAQNNPPLKEERGWTPLHYAAYQDDYAIAELLLLRGGSAIALVKDFEDQTPLDIADNYITTRTPLVRPLLQQAMAKGGKS